MSSPLVKFHAVGLGGSLGGSAKTTTSYTYDWWDSAKQKEVVVAGDNGQPGWAQGFSRFTYDVNGNIKSATDVVGKREFRYLVDGDGQVLRRDEYLGSETNAAGELVSARGNHHIPSANRMALEGVSKGDGIAINMEQPFPGVGGRHRATFTYGTKAGS